MNTLVSLLVLTLFFAFLLILVFYPAWRGADPLQKRILLAVVVLTPLLVLFSYLKLGAYQDILIRDQYQSLMFSASQGQEISEEDWEALFDRIEKRVEQTDKAEYWYLLAGSYEQQQRFDLASESYARAAEVYSDDVSILARWTESEFLAQGYNLTPKVQELSERVLILDPSNATVLGVLGIAAFQEDQYQSAINYWSRALSGLPAESENARVIQGSIMLARQQLAETGETVTEQSAEVADSPGIALSIQLAPGIEVDPSTTLFVIARIPGSPMPTAVTRLVAGDLPAEVSLTDAMAMIPGTSLMNLPNLEVVARLSFSGQPAAQSGDYEVIKSGIVPTELDAPIELIIADQIQ